MWELIHIPRELVNPRTSHHRLVIEIFINELSCEALIDLGASVSGMSLSFYQRSQLPPTQTSPTSLVCRTIIGESVEASRVIPQVLLTMGAFTSKENLLLLPISRSYDVLIDMDFLSRHRAVLYCDPLSPIFLTLERGCPPTSPNPLLDNVIHDLCLVSAKPQHDLRVLTQDGFLDLRDKTNGQHRNATFDPHSTKSYLVHVMCMEVPTSSTNLGIPRPPEPKPSPDWPNVDVAKLTLEFEVDPGKPTLHDPFVVCPPEVLKEVNKPRKDCVALLKKFREVKYSCFGGMNHESEIQRKHEVPMSIELKDEFKTAPPPRGRTYKTPIHLLPILKKSLSEMLKADWIRPSRSEWCAPILIIPKPHQDLKNLLSVEEVKYHVYVDLSDLNTRTKTLYY